MISEDTGIHIDLKRPRVICDQKIDSEGTQLGGDNPMPNYSATILFIGKPRSGKSSLAFSMIATKNKCYHRLFSKIFIVIPPTSLSSLSIKQIKRHKRIYPELNIETLEKIDTETDELNEEQGKAGHSLIIFDDVGSSIKSDHRLEERLKEFSWNFRHRSRTQWYLLQTYRSLSLGIRKVATHLIIFKLSQLELELIQNELVLWVSKRQWIDICRHVYDAKYGKHSAMYIDLENQKIYRLTDNHFYLLKIQE